MAQARSCGGPWAQNFALFFPLSRSHFRVFSSLSGGSSRGILVVFWSAGTLRCARFCPRGCRVKAPRRPAGQQPTTNNQQQTTNNHTTTNNHHTPHTLSHTTTHRHKPHTPHTQQHTTHTNTIAPTRSGPKSVGPNSVIAVISASVAQRVQLHPSRSPPHVSTDALTRPLRPCLTSVTASSSAVLSCEPESRRARHEQEQNCSNPVFVRPEASGRQLRIVHDVSWFLLPRKSGPASSTGGVAPRSSSLCQHERARTVWSTQSEWSRRGSPT